MVRTGTTDPGTCTKRTSNIARERSVSCVVEEESEGHAVIRSLPRRPAANNVAAASLLAVLVAAPVVAPVAAHDPDKSGAAARERRTGPAGSAGFLFGIDVSHWQSFIRWRRVASAGVDFAIAKATDGTWMVDHWYERNRRRAQRNDVNFTAYHFARPGRAPGDARREADYFLKHADLRARNLTPALDIEASGGLRPRALRAWVLAWLRRVENRLGVKPIIYTSPGFWTGQVDNSRRIARRGYEVLWLAHYDTRRPSVPARRWAGNSWTFWQWTECGRVRGVRGCVDRNYYRGDDIRDLTIRRLSRGPARPT